MQWREEQRCPPPGGKCLGNPCNPGNGNKLEQQVVYGGLNGFGLVLTINSFDPAVTRFGRHWRDSFERRVQVDGANVVTYRADGKALRFTPSGSDWVTDADTADRLIELKDAGGTRIGWRFQAAAGDEVETYDAAGRLITLESRSGLMQTLNYSDGTTGPNGGVVLDANGNPTAIPLQSGMLIRVRDHFGRTLTLGYNSEFRVVKATDPAGGTYRFTYATPSRMLVSIEFPDQKVRTYVYNEPANTGGANLPGALTGIIDENGVRYATFQYDSQQRATASEHAGGALRYEFSYGTGSTMVTHPLGAVRTYNFQNIFGATKNTGITGPVCPECGPASQTFDDNGNVQTRTDWNGNRTNYTSYDLTRNLELSRTEGLTSAGGTTPETRTISTQWGPVFRLPTGIAEPLRITTNVYDLEGSSCGARGALCSKSIQATTDANGSLGFGATPTGSPRTWTYTYNANGSVLTANGPRTEVPDTDITSYSYYANDDPDLGKRGNVATITNALGHVTQITEYNAHGQPLTVIDPNGLTTTLGYDERQRLNLKTAGGEVTGYEYYPTGLLKKVTLPDGSFLFYTYDAAHRLTDINDSLGNLVHYGLDAMGNRTLEEVRDPAGVIEQTRSREFNTLNRLWHDISAQGKITEYGYDDQGNVTSVNGPLAGTVDVTTQQYDALNRLKSMLDPDSGLTSYGYNGLDRLTSVTDPRTLETTYDVNGLGDLKRQVSPDTGTTDNTYDSAGNLQTSKDAKDQVTTYTYDALNRVSTITFHDGSRQTYTYDQGVNGIGRLTRIADTDPQAALVAQIDYTYDAHGRILTDTQAFDSWGTQHTTAYQYDSLGRLEKLTYPFSGPTSGGAVNYSYDTQGRVSALSVTYYDKTLVPPATVTRTVVQNVLYQPFGGVREFQFGNGQTYSRPYDLDGRVESYTLGATAYSLGYDDASRLTGISEVGNPGNVNAYGYDDLDRLTSAVLPATAYSYGYDATGNRQTKTAGASTDTYAYPGTSNRLASITPSSGPARTYVHDSLGSVTDDGRLQNVYDTRGRLVQSTNVAACLVSKYRVSALGQRVRKTVTTCDTQALVADTLYIYDLAGHLIAETTPTGQYKRAYLYLGDQPVGMFHESYD